MRLNQSSVRWDIEIWANCAAFMMIARFVKIMKLDVLGLTPGLVVNEMSFEAPSIYLSTCIDGRVI